jgi:hypothetical protein
MADRAKEETGVLTQAHRNAPSVPKHFKDVKNFLSAREGRGQKMPSTARMLSEKPEHQGEGGKIFKHLSL